MSMKDGLQIVTRLGLPQVGRPNTRNEPMNKLVIRNLIGLLATAALLALLCR